MKVIVIEDERPAAQNLVKSLTEIDPGIEVQACLSSIRDTVTWLKSNVPELIFLDIHLSDGLSFKIFELIDVKVPVIFTTAYDQYAIKAFEVNSIDYLLKPIKYKDLERSLTKYHEIYRSNKPLEINFQSLLDSIANKKPLYQQRILVFAGQKLKSISVEQIAFFYIIEKAVFLTTFSEETYAIDYSLDKVEPLLNPEQFFRVNRQIIININAIRNMYPMSNRSIKIELTPAPKEEVFVSIQRLSGFKNWLNR